MSSPSFYQIRQCQNATCRLRYPLTEAHPFGERCPLCLGTTHLEIQRPLTADRRFDAAPQTKDGPRVEAFLDNVRSAWNVGAIFRTADAFGVRHIHLGGITPTPENKSVAKTALGADQSIPWTHNKNGLAMAEKLKVEGYRLWALEQDERAVSIDDIVPVGYLRLPALPIVLIVGNEVTGVDPGILDLCDKIIYIPMRGEKRSLNVEVAFGVAVSLLVF